MILPIVTYGDPVLNKRGVDISPDYPDLQAFIDHMFDTMYAATGVGLAAQQVGKAIRLFIVDATPFGDEEPELSDFKKVFINPEIIEESGEGWTFNEGCLSFPDLRLDVRRKSNIVIRYFDRDFVEHTEELSGMAARIVQHEYDHVEGVVFIDHISPLRKRMVKGKLNDYLKGSFSCDYKVRPYSAKR